MTKPAVAYSIPMKGQGSYNAHSDLQRDSVAQALAFLHDATVNATNNSLSQHPDLLNVLEYGASHGANSILPLETVLQATNKHTVAVALNDRPENDFTTLSLTITRWEDKLDRSKYPHQLFTQLLPRSFYKPLSALRDTDVGYCFTCLHFLETIPQFPDSDFTAVRSNETKQLIRARAHEDLQKFLSLRAQEFVPGGQLVLSIITSGPDGQGPDFFMSGPGAACRLAISALVRENRISEDMLKACVIPVYFRTMDDIRATLDTSGVMEHWSLGRIEQADAVHPFWVNLEKKKSEGTYTRDDSIAYAKAIVEWFFTVFEGFFLRSLTTNGLADWEARNVLHESRGKTIEMFLDEFMDKPVYLPSAIVLLERRA